ncbi:MAG TPA: primary-amine oxidase [Pseudonocardia sp.]|jgi:primary-amine oxidase|nr:primary-amine oxidase [Pseudonocardia sp.]
MSTSVDPAVAQRHPSDAIEPAEVTGCRQLLVDAGLVLPTTTFAYFGLAEPDRSAVAAHSPGDPVSREFRVMLIDTATGHSHDAMVSTSESRVVSVRELEPAVDGGVPVIGLEFEIVEQIVHADPRWLAAMARRGLTDLSVLRAQPLSAGVAGNADETGRRLQRVFTFLQKSKNDLPWAHPVDGVTAYVDVISREVIDVIDDLALPVPDEDANFHDPEFVGPTRTGLRPIEISQPDGPSFTLDGNELSWLGWRLRVGFDAREGLVLRDVSIDDRGRRRPLLHRASIAEMVVPYADPRPNRWFQNFFDCGEYLLGSYANSLELGCDCVGDITYLDVVLADGDGNPRLVPRAICIHEEDAGILWKHTDPFTGSSDSRRQRRLVVSFFTTVGNYDYGFYWYFYLDGTIELEVKATGVVFTSGYPGAGFEYASQLAPGLGAPYHQHLFVARLDTEIDGPGNAVDELEVVRVPVGEGNPHGNGFTQSVRRLATESGAARLADTAAGRVWRIVNTTERSRFGAETGYVLHPEGRPTLLAQEGSDIHRRATAATKHLWVTPYRRDERYPAGDFVNQHPGGAGLPAWTAADRPVDGGDIVVWHTFGMTHFPRLEDWPVMPVDTCGFSLKPSGFFNANPTLDVPASNHCDH